MSVFNIDVMDNTVRDSFLIELKREMGLVGDENLSQDIDENLSQDIDENLSQDMFPNKQVIIPIITISDSESSPSETGCDGDENLSQDNSVRDSYVEDIMNNNELPPLEKDETMQWYSARFEARRLAKQQSQDMFPTEEHVFVQDSESTQDMFHNKQFQQLHDEMVQKYWSATPERSKTLKEASKDFLRFCAIVVKSRNEELLESISEWEQAQTQEESDIDE